MERQNRLIRTVAAAFGADVDEGSSSNSRPVGIIDPKEGGEATPLFTGKEVSQLPINLGYSIIDKDSDI